MLFVLGSLTLDKWVGVQNPTYSQSLNNHILELMHFHLCTVAKMLFVLGSLTPEKYFPIT